MSTTLASLRLQSKQRADMEKSKFLDDDEWDRNINLSYKELYDLLIGAYEDYYLTGPVAFTIASGNTYTLPADFYKLRGVDTMSSGSPISVGKFNFNERNYYDSGFYPVLTGAGNVQYRLIQNKLLFLPTESAPGNYQLWYAPKAVTLVEGELATLTIQDILYTAVDVYSDGNLISIEYTAGGTAGSEVVTVVDNAISVQIEDGVSTADQIVTAITASAEASALVTAAVSGTGSTVQVVVSATNLSDAVIQVDMDDVNGYDEYVIVDAALKALGKEESPTSDLWKAKAAMVERLTEIASNRDISMPEQIADVTSGYGLGYGRYGY